MTFQQFFDSAYYRLIFVPAHRTVDGHFEKSSGGVCFDFEHGTTPLACCAAEFGQIPCMLSLIRVKARRTYLPKSALRQFRDQFFDRGEAYCLGRSTGGFAFLRRLAVDVLEQIAGQTEACLGWPCFTTALPPPPSAPARPSATLVSRGPSATSPPPCALRFRRASAWDR